MKAKYTKKYWKVGNVINVGGLSQYQLLKGIQLCCKRSGRKKVESQFLSIKYWLYGLTSYQPEESVFYFMETILGNQECSEIQTTFDEAARGSKAAVCATTQLSLV